MDIEKLIERLNKLYQSLRLDGEQQCSPEINTVAFGLMDAATALSTLQAENEKLRAELEQVKRENNALWTYIEIVDGEYRRYMDRGYIDRLDELRRTWKRGQKED